MEKAPIRVYKYGLLAPVENAGLVHEQMRAAHQYRNTLVEIERGRRTAMRAATATHASIAVLFVEVQTATETLNVALNAVTRVRKSRSSGRAPAGQLDEKSVASRPAGARVHKSRSSDGVIRPTRATAETAEMRAVVTAAREARKVAVGRLVEARRLLREDPRMLAECDRINEVAAGLRRNARAHTVAFWGTYQLIEDADNQARKAPLYDGAEPNDPRFSRWSGEGQVSVQLQRLPNALVYGMPVEDVFGSDTRLRISSPVWRKAGRSEKTPLRPLLSLRVGSVDRDPIWAVWPIIMHRSLPDDAVIKRATVSLRKYGPREEWSVEITVAEKPRATSSTEQGSAVAIDIGWRVVPSGIRVGVTYSTDSAIEEIVLPTRLLGAIEKANDVRSIRDKHFDLARPWLRAVLDVTPNVPEWLIEHVRYLGIWKSPAKLAGLALRWKNNRFINDDLAFAALESWRRKDYHLWQWESGARRSSLRWRKETYRILGARLASKYQTLVLENFDLRRVAKKQKTEEPNAENENARSNRQRAAVSELRDVLTNAFTSRGGTIAIVDAANTTRTCNVCGLVEAWDAAATIRHTCPACATDYDQDENAAVNILERWNGDQSPGGARKSKTDKDSAEIVESRWIRAKRLAAEKKQRKTTAREVVDNAAE